MENITKALLIAGAILLVILILSTIMLFWDEMAAYFSATHDAKMVEQLTEFNKSFDNYSGQTIRGNELVSLMNRIIDYNNYQSDMIGYEKILITIDFINSKYTKELKYDNEKSSNSIFTFTNNEKGKSACAIKNTSTSDEAIARISGLSSDLISTSGIKGITDVKLQKLSAEISNIVDDEKATDKEAYKKARAEKLTQILGYTINKDDNVDKIKIATYKYYQFTQFKRAMFKCKEVKHDSDKTGRVNEIKFEVVLENGGIKFD